MVRGAKESFRRGDLFEVVPGQTFFESALDSPATVFGRLRRRNPAPYGFLMNLGESEYLIGASPEMFVRVEGRRVETCPISGTIRRGRNAIEDAEQIKALITSEKDESELTMCTDVDRNDKSRICEPGSVRVIGRRQIELYSRLIHTVDHVEGTLRPAFDALDAFLCHAWAVTVTGAPKAWAMQFIEDHERSSRAWYGGAVGLVGFDGNLNTGLTLRTIRVQDGVAQVRVGATLLYDSDPEAEEEETHVKASALMDAIRRPDGVAPEEPRDSFTKVGVGKRILLVDHQDSFVHTLANYLRQTGAEVVTWRSGFPHADLDALAPDLVVLSPGPGNPADFDLSGTLAALRARRLPVFGVCLGSAGHGRASRRQARRARLPDARQAVVDRRARRRALRRPAQALPRRPLPLALRAARLAAERAARARRERGRRRDGDRAHARAARGRAVPPGVDPDAGGARAAAHRERGGEAVPRVS